VYIAVPMNFSKIIEQALLLPTDGESVIIIFDVCWSNLDLWFAWKSLMENTRLFLNLKVIWKSRKTLQTECN